MKITEQTDNKVVPVNLSADNIITAKSGPGARYVALRIDADMLTLGITAKILAARYEQHKRLYQMQGLVPDNLDELVDEAVRSYLDSNRTGITMIRKG